MFFTFFRDILKVSRRDVSHNQIAFGAVLGVFFGLVPGILLKIFIFALIMIMQVNIAAAFASAAVFWLIGLFTDPVSDRIGFFILNADSLVPFWSSLYNIPVVPFTKFNNTVVMGNIALSFILSVPVYLLSIGFVAYYRKYWRDRIAKWRIVKLLTAKKAIYN
ncbi:MAG: TIGR03546 family protein [Endomicrobia bacterium]|nr:TIGR03546 family protein [Endomicrobiia bacterium]